MMKILSLIVLTLQNALLVIMMKISKNTEGPSYINSTAVFHMEFFKLFTCLIISIIQEFRATSYTYLNGNDSKLDGSNEKMGSTTALLASVSPADGNSGNRLSSLRRAESGDIEAGITNTKTSPLGVSPRPMINTSNLSTPALSPGFGDAQTPTTPNRYNSPNLFDEDFWKLSVPALLYFVQNNLLFVAIENLDSLTFQLLYQLKIITTALFSVTMLDRRLSMLKWFSLLVLFIGVVFVQLNPPTIANAAAANTQQQSDDSAESAASKASVFIGVGAVLISSITSGFSGVYFEKILKSSRNVSIWHRNIQLGLFSCFFATLNLFLLDYQKISKFGFFYGYTPMVWGVVVNQGMGGLLVAVVVKYADNILKGFATSGSIILGGIAGVIWLNLSLNSLFMLGASLVITAVYMYSLPENNNSSSHPLPKFKS